MARQRRRQFLQGSLALAGLGVFAGCRILPPQTQSPAKVPRVGWLGGGAGISASDAAFRDGLVELGYVEGQTIAIEHRAAGGSEERLRDLASELVGLDVDVLVTNNFIGAAAVRDASNAIPIIVLAGGDPVQAGLAASFARPGGRVTGVTAISHHLSGKRLALLQEATPSIARIGVLWNLNSTTKAGEWRETERAAETLGLQVHALGVRSPGDLEGIFEAARAARVDALVAFHDSLTLVLRSQIAEFALGSGLPSMFEFSEWTAAGGLLSYGPNRPAMYRRAATYVDKILKGTPPGDIPIEQPTTFEYVVNLKTARVLGLTIPPSVLAQATEIIQ